ncbi:MAG: class I SAM-dependent methyltransferase [Magnetococcales bacterium]|nr:class I SAM-dependent methyltransferase [Magnetococcales bacterium]MBF0630568.1 class I SAM-dependent methyltransferase [Magnetococcales bacterium]
MEPDTYKNMAASQDVHWWFHGRRLLLKSMIQRLPLPPDARILDAGCGTGANLDMLHQFGTVWGMEPNAFALERAKTRSHSIVEYGTLPDQIPFAPINFHMISLLDVLSCCQDDGAVIRALSARLIDGGWLVVTTPAYGFLWSSHDNAQHHHRRYHMNQLRSLLEQGGLEVSFTTYFNTVLFPLIAMIRIFKRITGLFHGDDTVALPHPWLNHFFFHILSFERNLISRGVQLPFGVSILALAQKKG